MIYAVASEFTMSPVLPLLFVTLIGCSEEPAAPVKAPAPPAAKPAPKPEPPPAPKVDESALVPSPAQVAADLAAAGITADVEKLVKKGTIKATADSKDEVAVRTGVILAHLVLTAKTAPKAETLERLAAAKEGFTAMGAGGDLPRTIDDLTTRLQNDAINSADLVVELDELSRVLVAEVSYEAGPRCIPLIKAGGWLAGTNVVAGAIDASGKTDSAAKLLKRPDVVQYFMKFTAAEGQTAPPMVMTKLDASLKKLDTIAKKDPIAAADVKDVVSATGDVLSLL